MPPWHEDDAWWESMAETMFPPERMEAAAGQVEGLLALVGAGPGLSVLDLGCGPGRHSVELARRGLRVTGVDRTSAYLERARAAAADAGVEVEFARADMRSFVRPGAFDLAVNLFTTFGYFEDPEDDRRVLDNLRRSLRPGGRLVIDTMGREVFARILAPRGWDRLADGRFLLQERCVSDDWTWVESAWILAGPDGIREHAASHRLYGAADLAALLRDVGFAGVAIFGSLEGAPYDVAARRLVLVATAP